MSKMVKEYSVNIDRKVYFIYLTEEKAKEILNSNMPFDIF